MRESFLGQVAAVCVVLALAPRPAHAQQEGPTRPTSVADSGTGSGVGVARASGTAYTPWEEALAHMPLEPAVTDLNRTNCVPVMLEALHPNDLVKALIFMPGATDELYFFHRAQAKLSMPAPTLLDAVRALTNQTLIRLSFYPPLVLLHSDEDPLEPILQVKDPATAERVRGRQFLRHASYSDRDWGTVEPDLRRSLRVEIRPWHDSNGSWHFYRHSFAAWNLTGWEALEAVALAGKTTVSIEHKRIVFAPDRRVRVVPKLDHFPH